MGTLLTGLFVFTALTMLLVGALLSARRFLVPHGEVPIVINGDARRTVRAETGNTLLTTLSDRGIFVPSGCGGKGTCGGCRVTVREGGGDLLPTEEGFISRGEARRGRRLACQVKVRRPMQVELPSDVFSVGQWRCRVIANRNVSAFIKELKLALPDGVEVPFRAGGYVQIRCPPHEISFRDFDIGAPFSEEWDRLDLWRFKSIVKEPVERAYSMANFPLEKGTLLFTIRLAFPPNYDDNVPPGKVSSWLFSLKPGDEVTVAGPYGEFFARDTNNEMCFVAAGAGMAPMRSHILDQLLRLKSERKMTFWYSARNLGEAFYIDEFNRLQAEHPNFEWHLVLSEPRPEDRWTGPVGLVRHNVLRDQYLADHYAPEDIEYYLCGPDVMNKAVIKMLNELGVEREHILLDNFG
jgi:Na+-transporting NADH:ubiquinone oxidoreductase subunit F